MCYNCYVSSLVRCTLRTVVLCCVVLCCWHLFTDYKLVVEHLSEAMGQTGNDYCNSPTMETILSVMMGK